MGDTERKPKSRLHCILIFNGPQFKSEHLNVIRAKDFFSKHGFEIYTILLCEKVEDLKAKVCAKVSSYKDDVFWVCCVVAPGKDNLFLLSDKGTPDGAKVSLDLVKKWFIESRCSPNSRVVFVFDLHDSPVAKQFEHDGEELCTVDKLTFRFVSYTKWVDGISPCMEHFCREGSLSSLVKWIKDTRDLIVKDESPTPETSGIGNDPFDITKWK